MSKERPAEVDDAVRQMRYRGRRRREMRCSEKPMLQYQMHSSQDGGDDVVLAGQRRR